MDIVSRILVFTEGWIVFANVVSFAGILATVSHADVVWLESQVSEADDKQAV